MNHLSSDASAQGVGMIDPVCKYII